MNIHRLLIETDTDIKTILTRNFKHKQVHHLYRTTKYKTEDNSANSMTIGKVRQLTLHIFKHWNLIFNGHSNNTQDFLIFIDFVFYAVPKIFKNV